MITGKKGVNSKDIDNGKLTIHYGHYDAFQTFLEPLIYGKITYNSKKECQFLCENYIDVAYVHLVS